MKRIILSLIGLILLGISCTKDPGKLELPSPGQQPPNPPTPPTTVIDDDTKDYGPYVVYPAGQKALNIIYFLPADYKGPLNQYQRRLSRLMFFFQDWYLKEMRSYGFDKTFGLLRSTKDPNYIKILVIKGKEGRNGYPYEGGGSKALQEIAAWFAANPAEKASEHNLVFLPSLTGDGKGNNEGGVPYYGLGRSAFVLDYRYFDISFWPQKRDTANYAWAAGHVHELGHALNLPHNKQLATSSYEALMSWHMPFEDPATHSKSHLNFADAVILNVNEVFNPAGTINYYQGQSQFNLKSTRIFSDANNVYYRAKFMSSIPVKAVVVYHDPKTSANDGDYNAITWANTEIIPVTGGDSVSLAMPLSGFQSDIKQYPFEMRVKLLHENGSQTNFSYNYSFSGERPFIDVNYEEIITLPTVGWSITASSFNSVTEDGKPENILDGNTNTIWHSRWATGTDPLPYILTIDMKASKDINGFMLTNRKNNAAGRVKEMKVELSDNGTSWNDAGTYNFENTDLGQAKNFAQTQTKRYIRLTITDVHSSATVPNPDYANLAEFGVF